MPVHQQSALAAINSTAVDTHGIPEHSTHGRCKAEGRFFLSQVGETYFLSRCFDVVDDILYTVVHRHSSITMSCFGRGVVGRTSLT